MITTRVRATILGAVILVLLVAYVGRGADLLIQQ